ncbi:MAG: hypothetical protein ACJ8EY_06065 [Sphingomicrobium sp.]
MPILLLLLALSLASCQEPEKPASSSSVVASPQPSVPAKSPSANVVTSLSGEWRVAGIDGSSLDEPYGLALRGDEESLWWEPRCARIERKYKIRGKRINFHSGDAPVAVGSLTTPVCAIGLPPRLHDVLGALDAATTVERTPANGIHISGNGHSLTLFSQ